MYYCSSTSYSSFLTCRRGLLSWFQLPPCSRRRQINTTKVLISSYKVTRTSLSFFFLPSHPLLLEKGKIDQRRRTAFYSSYRWPKPRCDAGAGGGRRTPAWDRDPVYLTWTSRGEEPLLVQHTSKSLLAQMFNPPGSSNHWFDQVASSHPGSSNHWFDQVASSHPGSSNHWFDQVASSRPAPPTTGLIR